MNEELELLRDKKGFICDMDGVIYHGNRLLPGVPEFVDWLQRENKSFLFLTNSSERSPLELQQKLARMGLEIGEEQGFTQPGTARRVKALLSRFGLPVEPADVSPAALKEVLSYDKKGAGKDITVVLCRKVGESFLHRMPKAQFACWACGESEGL